MLQAAEVVAQEETARITLVGDPGEIEAAAKEAGADISGAEIVDHQKDEKFEEYVAAYHEKRKHKGVDEAQARQVISDPLFFGASLVKDGRQDGMVAGAVNATANVLRSTMSHDLRLLWVRMPI